MVDKRAVRELFKSDIVPSAYPPYARLLAKPKSKKPDGGWSALSAELDVVIQYLSCACINYQQILPQYKIYCN